jgi:DNA-binding transcriptional ArsR family regulator
MVKFIRKSIRNKSPIKIKSIQSIRKFNILKNKNIQVSSEALEVKTHREILIDLGIEKRYLKASLKNRKSTGTALTRLEKLMEHFDVPSTREAILSFFLDLSPASIEEFANHMSESGKSPSTVYATLIGYSHLNNIILLNYYAFNCFL